MSGIESNSARSRVGVAMMVMVVRIEDRGLRSQRNGCVVILGLLIRASVESTLYQCNVLA